VNVQPSNCTLHGNTGSRIGCFFMDLDFGHVRGLLKDSIPYMVTTSPEFNMRKRILLSLSILLREGVLYEFRGEVRRENTPFSLKIMNP
jgi:hypothetical protein